MKRLFYMTYIIVYLSDTFSGIPVNQVELLENLIILFPVQKCHSCVENIPGKYETF